MRRCVTSAVLVSLLFTHTLSSSITTWPGDDEASGSELESSGDGAEKGSARDETAVVRDRPGSFVNDGTLSFPNNLESSYIIVPSKGVLENKDIVAAIITGGVTGAILGTIVTAILIYRSIRKDREGYSQTRQS